MWDFDHNTLPKSLSSLFSRREEVHDRNLRDKQKLYTSYRFNDRYGYNSFSHQGAMLLNKFKDLLPYHTYSAKGTFLKSYKASVLETY